MIYDSNRKEFKRHISNSRNVDRLGRDSQKTTKNKKKSKTLGEEIPNFKSMDKILSKNHPSQSSLKILYNKTDGQQEPIEDPNSLLKYLIQI